MIMLFMLNSWLIISTCTIAFMAWHEKGIRAIFYKFSLNKWLKGLYLIKLGICGILVYKLSFKACRIPLSFLSRPRATFTVIESSYSSWLLESLQLDSFSIYFGPLYVALLGWATMCRSWGHPRVAYLVRILANACHMH